MATHNIHLRVFLCLEMFSDIQHISRGPGLVLHSAVMSKVHTQSVGNDKWINRQVLTQEISLWIGTNWYHVYLFQYPDAVI